MYGWEPIGQQPVFFRLRMQPVTLGHLDLLAELGIDVQDGIAPDDVATVAFVCSQRHDRSRKDIGQWWCKHAFKFWGWLCGADAFKQSDPFLKWFFGQLKGPLPAPRKISDAGESREIAAPLVFHLLACCMGMLGRTEREAMDMPVIRARQLVAALAEAQGNAKLWTRRDEERRELSVAWGLVEPRRN